jgi:hypothetical protein
VKIITEEFNSVLNEVLASSAYKKFSDEHKEYVLANGFTQLNANKQAEKPWQLSFYNKGLDHLAVFDTVPEVSFNSFQQAVKFDGDIPILDPLPKLSTAEAIEIVEKEVAKNPEHVIRNFLVIIQHTTEPVYNITVITLAFAMLTYQINSEGNIIHSQVASVMDLKQNLKGDAE